jgi:hypothetical protein
MGIARWLWLGSVVGLVGCGEVELVEQVAWSNQGKVCLSSTERAQPVPTGSTGDTGHGGDATESSTTTSSTTDTGRPVVVFERGDVLVAEVTFGGCDCGETATRASCTATRDGDQWTVVSEARSLESCDPCEPIVARCELGVPAMGSHTISHGGDRLVIEVPGELDPSCMGAPVQGEPL